MKIIGSFLAFALVFGAAGPAAAQAVPKVGACASGYHPSGGACIPNSGAPVGPALIRVGACPTYYHPSGDYCLGGPGAKHAFPKTGACPTGYHPSGAYCLAN